MSLRQSWTWKHGAIAQLGEHLLCKQGVVGSIPTGSTRVARGITLRIESMNGSEYRAEST